MLSGLKTYLGFAPNNEKRKNINDTLRPLYVVTSLVGLFPYSIKFQKQSFVIIHKSIYINTLFAITIVLIICIFVVMHLQLIYLTHNDNPMMDVALTHMNYIFEIFTLNTFCIVAYVCAFLNRLKFVKILNKFAKWTEVRNAESDKILKAVQPKIRLVIGFLIFLYLNQHAVNVTRKDTVWKTILCHFTLDLPQFIQCINIGFYYILVCTVSAIISSITDHVNALNKIKPVFNCFVNVEYKSSLTLKQLESMYIEVYDVKQDIIKAFQACIFATIMQTFHSIISEAHIIYHGVGQCTLSIHEIVNCSIWVVYQLIKIYALSHCGNILKVENIKLGQALYSIPTEKHDVNLLAEIQHFSTLLEYYGGDLSVYGLFSVNATLLFKVVGSAVMYFIILIQMDENKVMK